MTLASRTALFIAFIIVVMSQVTLAHHIIAPLPFSIVNKNYIKLQVLADANDLPADSASFDISYNGGKTMSIKLDQSLSHILRLNDFNDGVFFVQARVYQKGKITVLGSKFDPAGIPVILDRHTAINETRFNASYLLNRKILHDNDAGYEVDGNNNTMVFNAFWDSDSLYFNVQVNDANLNYKQPDTWDLFQAKDYLEVLWNSDCIEVGMDLNHDRSEWKQLDDVELVVDLKGNKTGNRWSAEDSIYEHWGSHTRTSVVYRGTTNNNTDIDEGYTIQIAIPWSELRITPREDMTIGFDIQLYDKDADLDESFRTSLSGTNPESNDNTSEWTTLVLQRKNSSAMLYWLFAALGCAGVAILVYTFVSRQRQKEENEIEDVDLPVSTTTATPSYSQYTDTALKYIESNFHDPELSRHQIADHVALTEKYLSTLFKKEVGVNLVSYINKFRIERSVELLQNNKFTVAEIAFKVGYNSLQNFNKNFRLVTGKTPSDYRKH